MMRVVFAIRTPVVKGSFSQLPDDGAVLAVPDQET